MRASTAHTEAASNLAQFPAFDPLVFELTDQVVLTFQASDIGGALNANAASNTATTNFLNSTTAITATEGDAHAAHQPVKVHGWRLTLRGNPGAGDSFTVEGVLSQPVLLDPVGQRPGGACKVFVLPDTAMPGGWPTAQGRTALSLSGATRMPAAAWTADLTDLADTSTPLASALHSAGVMDASLHPQTARLFLPHQSYQAAARFLQIAQTTLDTLVQAVRADNEEKS